MKKLLIALFAVAVAFSAAASSGSSAQSSNSKVAAIAFASERGDSSPVPNPFTVRMLRTPFFKVDNEDQSIYAGVSASKYEEEMNNAKHWLSVDVTFNTYPPPSKNRGAWAQWLDDVVVEINVFIPITDGRGNVVDCGVLGGKQTLSSLKVYDFPCLSDSDDNNIQKFRKEHTVRMMIPPEIIYRYFPIEGSGPNGFVDFKKDYGTITSRLNEFARDLPMMASITYGGRTVYGIKPCGKTVFSLIDKGRSKNSNKNNRDVFYGLLKPDEGSAPTSASTTKLFDYFNKNKSYPKTFKYMPDELLPVSKTPFAWVRYDRFEPIKESSGK